MNPDKQRIAIAEACGWKRKPEFDYTSHLDPIFREHGTHHEMWGKDSGQLIPFSKIPDYLTDLNAMHEAEKVLTNQRRREYADMLVQVHPLQYDPRSPGQTCHDVGSMNLFLIASMTAAQRAEAFLRTIGKWEDDK